MRRPISRRSMVAVGALGTAAVVLYVGATILGGLLDPAYSHLGNAISELTASEAPHRAVLAPIYAAYNVVLAGFGLALFRASSRGTLFALGVVLFALGGLSGIGQVTLFRQDSVGAVATTAGTGHLVLAGVSSLLSLGTAMVYGFAFRREPAFRRLSGYSFVTAALLVMTAPLAVGTIGTDVMGLFERITIGVYLIWIVVVGVDALLAARTVSVAAARRGSVGATV